MGATCRNLKGIEPSWFLCASLPLGALALFGLLFIPAQISALLMGIAALAVLAIRLLYMFVTAHWRELQNGRAERLFAIGLLLVIYIPCAMLYRAN